MSRKIVGKKLVHRTQIENTMRHVTRTMSYGRDNHELATMYMACPRRILLHINHGMFLSFFEVTFERRKN